MFPSFGVSIECPFWIDKKGEEGGGWVGKHTIRTRFKLMLSDGGSFCCGSSLFTYLSHDPPCLQHEITALTERASSPLYNRGVRWVASCVRTSTSCCCSR